ncbi:MAG: response regulator transcription factor [Cyclobacteriaceae bacterium]|nr:response regulator transcription factor [Cyclobacteriaceae bacterium]
MKAEKIKVLITDDHQLVRDGFNSMLTRTQDMEVVGSVASAEDCINEVRETRPDVVLMDILMRGMTGIEASRWIKDIDPTIKVLIVSMEISKDYVSAGIKAGIDGYVAKDADADTLLTAIRTVHKGERYFNEAIVKLVFENFYTTEKLKTTARRLPHELTKREYEILALVASGKTNREIAESLFISIKTVETHKGHILEKLGLRNTAELVKYAIQNNIISVHAPSSQGKP